MQLPVLSRKDHIILGAPRKASPAAFMTNCTSFILGEMRDYTVDARCWRMAIMGETRGGKSEVGQTFAILYTEIFNQLLRKGHFDKQDVFTEGVFKKEELKFEIDNICSNQSNYIYTLRDEYKAKKIKFGQIRIIDESKKSIGGIGTFSELLDLKNINNIVAKFMQAEIWIQPLQFETNNTPYGLYVYKKDVENRVNWCLLYKIQRSAIGSSEFSFLGWVKVPLHTDESLRRAYNEKKNAWIMREMEGVGDERLEERKATALALSKDPEFSLRTISGKTFKFSKQQQQTILEDWIQAGKTQNWNQIEREMIVEEARRISEREHMRKEAGDGKGDKDSQE
jgi:hypothetical protein